MKRSLEVAALISMGAFSFACISLGILAIHADASSLAIAGSVDRTLQALNDPRVGTIHQLNVTIVRTRDLLTHIDQTANAARLASVQESAYLAQWNIGITRAINSADAALQAARNTTDGLNHSQAQIAVEAVATLRAGQQALAATDTVQANLSNTLTDLDGQIRATKPILENVNAATASTEASAKTIQEEIYHWAHPTFVQRIYQGFLNLLAHTPLPW